MVEENRAGTNDFFSTGSLKLDRILGGEGISKGSIVEIFGEPGAGKSTMALEMISSIQDRNGVPVFIDMEHALNRQYAEQVGVDSDDVLISQPEDGEEALEIAETFARSGAVDLVVLDSVAALISRYENDQAIRHSMSSRTHIRRSEMITRAMRKLSMYCREIGMVLILINQTRVDITRGGNPEKTPGGKSMNFYTTARIRLSRFASLLERQQQIGISVLAQIDKNREAPPFQRTTVDILFDRGICPYGEFIDVCLESAILKKKRRCYYFGSDELAGTREELRSRIQKDSKLRKRLIEETEFEEGQRVIRKMEKIARDNQ